MILLVDKPENLKRLKKKTKSILIAPEQTADWMQERSEESATSRRQLAQTENEPMPLLEELRGSLLQQVQSMWDVMGSSTV